MAAPGRPATADATGDRVWDATSADPRVAMQAAHKTCRLRLGRLLCSPRFVRRVAVARRAMPLSAGSPPSGGDALTIAPLVSFVTAGGLAPRLADALRAVGYRARPLPAPATARPAALEDWLAAHRPAALVLDARAVRLSAAPHLVDSAAARGVEVVVGSIYDEGNASGAAARPVGRCVGLADIVRAVQRALGPGCPP
jgi:hypothetical protein